MRNLRNGIKVAFRRCAGCGFIRFFLDFSMGYMFMLLLERLGYLGKDRFIVGKVGNDRGRHLRFRRGCALGRKNTGLASRVTSHVALGVTPTQSFALAQTLALIL